jgi:hypothetical protein
MKILSNTLKPVVERWTDPGGNQYNGAGAPVPSYNYMESIDGQIVLEFGASDLQDFEGYSQYLSSALVKDWLSDNAGEIDPDVPGLTVKKWSVDKLEGNRATLSVEEFECDLPDPPEREYDYDDVQWRRERREARDIEEMRAGD